MSYAEEYATKVRNGTNNELISKIKTNPSKTATQDLNDEIGTCFLFLHNRKTNQVGRLAITEYFHNCEAPHEEHQLVEIRRETSTAK